MRRQARLMAAALMAMAAGAQAATPRKAPATTADGSDAWVTFGGGYYEGDDYAPPPGATKTDAQKTGGWEGFAALNYGSRIAARLRASWLTEYTHNTAEEVAGEIGWAFAPQRVYAFAGVSRLTDVANDRQRPIVGVPLELLFYPTRGLEIGVHGNLNSQSDFIGVTLGGVFGKQRAR